jgi:hypothetical protein
MLCGNAAMIATCCELLDARGMRRHTHANPGHVSLEKYH